MKRTIVVFVLLVVTQAWAHEGKPHGPKPAATDRVMGTVGALDHHSLSLRTVEGKDVKVALDETTDFQESGRCATAAGLKPGARVVVYTRKADAGLVAAVVKFGRQPRPAPRR